LVRAKKLVTTLKNKETKDARRTLLNGMKRQEN